MKRIDGKEYKKILIELLREFDDICRKNNIKYTLVGGSLIGAVRHKGIIPWDDDIDVGMTSKEYDKFVNVIKNNNFGKYVFMSNENNKTYFYPFIKMVDTTTIVYEERVKEIKNYGIFLDIFRYNNLPNNRFLQYIYWYKLMFGLSIISGYAKTSFKKGEKYKFVKIIGKLVSKLFGIKKCIKWYNSFSSKYNAKKTDNVILCWPAYGFNNNKQKASDFIHYIDAKFEDVNSMIAENYDNILTTTFGNYMELPPIEKRICHEMEAYKK